MEDTKLKTIIVILLIIIIGFGIYLIYPSRNSATAPSGNTTAPPAKNPPVFEGPNSEPHIIGPGELPPKE